MLQEQQQQQREQQQRGGSRPSHLPHVASPGEIIHPQVPEEQLTALISRNTPKLSTTPLHLPNTLVVKIGQLAGDAGIPGVGEPDRAAVVEQVIAAVHQELGGGLQGSSFPADPTSAGAILPLYFHDTTAGILARDQLRTAPNFVVEVGGKSIVVPLGAVISEAATGALARILIHHPKAGEVAREGFSSIILPVVGLGGLTVRSEFLSVTGKSSGLLSYLV